MQHEVLKLEDVSAMDTAFAMNEVVLLMKRGVGF